MRSCTRLMAVVTAVLLSPCLAPTACAADQASWSDEEFIAGSSAASPLVAYALHHDGDRLLVAVEVESFTLDGTGTHVALGLAAPTAIILHDQDAEVTRHARGARYVFGVPVASLGSDLRQLRLGMTVSWAGGPDGADRQCERIHHGSGAAHDPLAHDPREWLPFDLAEYATTVLDRRNRIEIPIVQPMDGKATVVIEDPATGRRIRNLVSGVPMAKGERRIRWDGLDDHGDVVLPGTYRWRSIHHPGIVPDYRMTYANGDNTPAEFAGWGPNHTILTEAATSGPWTLVASAMTEGGDSLLLLDAQGRKTRGMNVPMGMGMWKISPTIIDDMLYIANDGMAWGDHVDEHDPKAVVHLRISLARYDLKAGQLKEWGNKRFLEIASAEVHPGGADQDWRSVSLCGLGALGNHLYLADRRLQKVLILDRSSGEKTGEFPLPAPAALIAANGALFAISQGAIIAIDPLHGALTTIVPAAAGRQPVALAVDGAGRIYVSDAHSSTVLIFDALGMPDGALGNPGGAYAGRYDPERMVNPRGLAVAANGWLWVAEDRPNPKRVLAWDPATRRVVCERFGSPPYGGSGAGIDPADASTWIGLGVQWRIDLAQHAAEPASILGANGQDMHFSYVRDHGVTYLIGFGGATSISKLNGDGSATPVALIASTHRFSFVNSWKPAQAFIDAFAHAYPERAGKHADKGPGFVWTDANGDGIMQSDEFDFSLGCENFAGAYFGHDFHDLTLRVPATVAGKRVLVTLKPEGFSAAGVPRYPKLSAACAQGIPIDLAANEVETTVDRFGDMICNSTPEMKAFAPDGRLLWTFPNRWVSVHGSHDAPLPETGVLQGSLFYLGTAPLDATSDVVILNGNHGRFFALTSDGLYLDEFFKDVRMGARADATLIGGEAFGGSFARNERDGTYYLQAGSFRIFRMQGLDQVTRAQGSVSVSGAQVVAAERALVVRSSDKAASRSATIPFTRTPPAIDTTDVEWTTGAAIAWSKSGRFPVSVRAAYDATTLYLAYDVADDSPWVNNGKDWTLLFKSGDSVDLQLGVDTKANPQRSGPVVGDCRLLIAPFQGSTIAVLYQHRLPGAANPMTFTCPWRSEKVDSVTRLEHAAIAVSKQQGRYRLKAAIPLADLGLHDLAGKTLKADVGVIYGDPDGHMNMLRSYWSNQNTGLVNDVPGEIMLTPAAWGSLTFTGEHP
jgi:hypothetical protein